MKYLTKENILLALVSLLVLAKANDLRQSRRGPERARGAIMERMRGMDRGSWGPRMDAKRGAKAEGVVLGVDCCEKKR